MNIHIQPILKHPATVPAVTGVVAFACGVGFGMFLASKRAQKAKDEENVSEVKVGKAIRDEDFTAMKQRLIDGGKKRTETEETEETKEQVKPPRVVVDAEVLNKQQVDQGEALVKSILSTDTPEESVEVVPEHRNVFASAGVLDDDVWDYEEEKKKRSNREPYVLHKDEFFGEELDYTQSTLTYFAGDDILVDEDQKPIYNYHQIIGELKFGHGSGDPNIFYVRNDQREGEYEIIVDPGLYSVEVLGLEIENNQRVKDLKHSNTPRKFRPE